MLEQVPLAILLIALWLLPVFPSRYARSAPPAVTTTDAFIYEEAQTVYLGKPGPAGQQCAAAALEQPVEPLGTFLVQTAMISYVLSIRPLVAL